MPSFHLPGKINGNSASISDAGQLHHLRDVLRLKKGDEITVFDVEGKEYLCIIRLLEKNQAILHIKAHKFARSPKWRLAIACAIPKQSKMDQVIDKLTQLGVRSIFPLVTERVVVKLDRTQQSRLERWEKIARSAAEQSYRNTLPFISPAIGLREMLAQSRDYDIKLVPTLQGERKSIKEVLSGSKPASILALIGPEGDFTPQEIQEVLNAGFSPVSLGDAILRVDTAAIAVASYIKLALMV
jgi:16S rRNA (uracil1498-N3)-methyltransferase